MSVTVVKQMVVQWGIKETWVPHQKDVDGVTYICLEKWNRQLVKFMYGRALDLRKDRDTKDLNVEMWTELVGLRQKTCDDMVALGARRSGAASGALRRTPHFFRPQCRLWFRPPVHARQGLCKCLSKGWVPRLFGWSSRLGTLHTSKGLLRLHHPSRERRPRPKRLRRPIFLEFGRRKRQCLHLFLSKHAQQHNPCMLS